MRILFFSVFMLSASSLLAGFGQFTPGTLPDPINQGSGKNMCCPHGYSLASTYTNGFVAVYCKNRAGDTTGYYQTTDPCS